MADKDFPVDLPDGATLAAGDKFLTDNGTQNQNITGTVLKTFLEGNLALPQARVTNLTTDLALKADKATTISAGTGLTGGGDLSANRTLTVAYGSTASTACVGNDSRLSDARTPLTHAASHGVGQSDAVTVAESQVTGLTAALAAKANGATTISAGTGLTGTGTLAANITLNVNLSGLSEIADSAYDFFDDMFALDDGGTPKRMSMVNLMLLRRGWAFFFDDFAVGASGWSTGVNGSGAQAAAVAASNVSDFGIFELRTQTAAASTRACVSAGTTSELAIYGSGKVQIIGCFRVREISSASEDFTIRVGTGDAIGSGTGENTDGVYLRQNYNVNSGKVECVCRSNSTETTADSGITLAADDRLTFHIKVNAAGTSAEFYLGVNGAALTLVATITTNIPTGLTRSSTLYASQYKTATGTGQTRLQLDYLGIARKLDTLR